MRVTDVRVGLFGDGVDRYRDGSVGLCAHARITFDESLVVCDARIVRSCSGLMVAMPSREVKERCSRCGAMNAIQANYCSHCGIRVPSGRPSEAVDESVQMKRRNFHDVVYPVSRGLRAEIDAKTIERFLVAVGEWSRVADR